MKVIYAEVECRVMQDQGTAALRRQLVTKGNPGMVWLGRDLKDGLGPSPCQEQGHFPLGRAALCFSSKSAIFQQPHPEPDVSLSCGRSWCWDSGLAASRSLPAAVTRGRGVNLLNRPPPSATSQASRATLSLYWPCPSTPQLLGLGL